jgi:prepilin-type N-terminal cleavage/methylation domain-containing protein
MPGIKKDGFTLLELVVVLVIIGLMSALVVPRLTGPLSNLDLKTAAKNISASLRYARSRAATEKIVYAALVDFDNNRLVIADTPLVMTDFLANDQEKIQKLLVSRLAGEQDRPGGIKTYQPPDGVRFEKGRSRDRTVSTGFFPVYFFPTGASSGGEITVANQRGRQYSLTIDFVTGLVRLSKVMVS